MFFFKKAPDIKKLQAEHNIQGLVDALGYEKDINIRIDAVIALGEIGDAQAVNALGAAIKDKPRKLVWSNETNNALLRESIIRALERIGNPEAKSYLKIALKDENADVRAAATKALKRLSERNMPIRKQVTTVKAVKRLSLKEVRQRVEDCFDVLKAQDSIHAIRLPGKEALKKAVDRLINLRTSFNEQITEDVVFNLIIASTGASQWHVEALDQIDPNWKKSAAAKKVIPYLATIAYRAYDLDEKIKKHWTSFKFSTSSAIRMLKILIAEGHSTEPLQAKVKDFAKWLDHMNLRTQAESFISLCGPGAVSAVGIVVESLKNSSSYPRELLGFLRVVLSKYGEHVKLDDLEAIAELDNVTQTIPGILTDDDWLAASQDRKQEIDCSLVRHLAKQEMLRRRG